MNGTVLLIFAVVVLAGVCFIQRLTIQSLHRERKLLGERNDTQTEALAAARHRVGIQAYQLAAKDEQMVRGMLAERTDWLKGMVDPRRASRN